ncbi:MAG: hypothetical protein DID92_2727745167 [Candidatus Nitrotoga sp. SPKER]|nr:MAG: hypothetical protein DID92_2727745167 [Candidatus Nitrotoga sp. SPKER]
MKNIHTKLKIASAVFGPMGALWIISLVTSYNSLSVHEGLSRAGLGLTCIAFALEPGILFQPLLTSLKEVSIRPPPFRSPFIWTLSISGLVCFLLAGITRLAS